MPRPGSLHHVELYVADLARTRSFWDWFLARLGYELFQQWPKGVSWKLGDTYLVFVQAETRHLGEPFHRCRPGLNHLAFHASSRAELDDWREALRERGVPLLYDDRYPFAGGAGYTALFFEDPDRLKVELVVTDEG